jgi:uncharacterized membrane protein
MSGVRTYRSEAQASPAGKRVLRLVMRVVMPTLMLGFGTYTVVSGGLQGLLALLPILAAHVVGFLVIYPLWIRYRKRRAAAPPVFED